MTKDNIKTNKTMTEIEVIKKTPELTEYIMRTKMKDVRKSAVIVAIVLSVLAFASGFLLGSENTKHSIPNNVVTIQLDGSEQSNSLGK